jgi:hypothetical protein
MEASTDPPRNLSDVKSALICMGIYFACGWLSFFFAVAYDSLLQRIVYHGDFQSIVVMPLVEHFPRALFAIVAGIAAVYFVDSERVWVWVVFLAVLYGGIGLLGYHWSRPPVFSDRVAQAIGSFFPAAACLFGGFVATRRSNASQAG